MRTKITLLLLLVASSISLKAQIHNPSFETWTSGDPDNWNSNNTSYPGIVTQVSDAHAGTSAAQLNVFSFFGSNIGGVLTSGTNSSQAYFPVIATPIALHGWYKFHSVSPNESVNIIGAAKNMGTSVGAFAKNIVTNTLVYTEFIAPFIYPGANIVDSVSILFMLTYSAPDSNHVASYFIVDDLTFGGLVGVNELKDVALLEPCSPNPATNVANIIYSVSGESKVSLAIYDIVGNEVKVLLEGLEQTTGRYKIPTDVSAMPDGIYFYRLNVNGQSYTQKLVVAK